VYKICWLMCSVMICKYMLYFYKRLNSKKGNVSWWFISFPWNLMPTLMLLYHIYPLLVRQAQSLFFFLKYGYLCLFQQQSSTLYL
jgi:hypothetical protein